MTKLTAVTISSCGRSRTWFLDLPVEEDRRVRLPESTLNELIRSWNLPRGSTISIG